jgi:hypothetical protein
MVQSVFGENNGPLSHSPLYILPMTSHDIIDLQLESFFGDRFPHKIQRLVDDELNEGRWVDGYHLAVCKGVIDGVDAHSLLEIILTNHPALRLDETELRKQVEECLPQSLDARVSWIVDDSGAFALTDQLRVARFDGTLITWRSPRISYDGIDFDGLTDGKLTGRAWLLGSHESPDARFIFDFETGALLDGYVVEHE